VTGRNRHRLLLYLPAVKHVRLPNERTLDRKGHCVEIHTLTDADAEAYYTLRLRALTEESEAFGSTADEFAETPLAEIAARLRPSDDAFFLGAWAPTLVGCVRFGREEGRKDRHKAFISGMYVVPEARGQGAGRALLQETLARAARLPGLEQVHLTVVTVNAAARTLYHSFGFVSYGIEPRTLKLDDGRYLDEELMWLPLPSADISQN
jgi:RimJ/RimL family protein N-acetyltransferase